MSGVPADWEGGGSLNGLPCAWASSLRLFQSSHLARSSFRPSLSPSFRPSLLSASLILLVSTIIQPPASTTMMENTACPSERACLRRATCQAFLSDWEGGGSLNGLPCAWASSLRLFQSSHLARSSSRPSLRPSLLSASLILLVSTIIQPPASTTMMANTADASANSPVRSHTRSSIVWMDVDCCHTSATMKMIPTMI